MPAAVLAGNVNRWESDSPLLDLLYGSELTDVSSVNCRADIVTASPYCGTTASRLGGALSKAHEEEERFAVKPRPGAGVRWQTSSAGRRFAQNLDPGESDVVVICGATYTNSLRLEDERFHAAYLAALEGRAEAIVVESMSFPVRVITTRAWRKRRATDRARALIVRLSAVATREDDAIEGVYDEFHRLIKEDRHSTIDEVLRVLNVKKHANSVLLSILTVTAMWEVRRRLQLRVAFYGRVKDLLALREGPQAAEDLLQGLE